MKHISRNFKNHTLCYFSYFRFYFIRTFPHHLHFMVSSHTCKLSQFLTSNARIMPPRRTQIAQVFPDFGQFRVTIANAIQTAFHHSRNNVLEAASNLQVNHFYEDPKQSRRRSASCKSRETSPVDQWIMTTK